MSEQKKQQLSMLMDGEFDHQTDQIIGDLIHDESLRNTWWRYHLISDALSSHATAYFDRTLADRISAQIKHEPTILVPNPSPARSFIKPVAGFAIAASVAAMAILGILHNRTEQVELQPQQIAVRQTGPTSGNTQFSLPSSPRPASLAVTRPEFRNVGANSRLNSYLVNYNEYRTTRSGMQGMLPYMRIIAYENDK